ncbi:BTAD domain-containing putative transcriptional regulator [Gordonia insulae]|uniref:HTH-type transcriptional regulator n=1 Tax=Gordonia insulae TaxID=2420509 RepID=A0A3G8JKI9_9ACTN|nr:BTAD domain-containing putative transcriptional regulator [Gordonia insulae]AZG45019.1 Putative HTH-type transcriptional regulator [Gordonia insulae]
MSASDSATVIGLLGPVAVGDHCSTPELLVPVPGVRARRLLVSLALADGRTRSAERLIDDVWGDLPPRSPASALHTQISRLRPLLGAGRLEGVAGGYRLIGCRTDLDIVAELIERGGPDALHQADGWWRGAPGDDLGDDAGAGLDADLRARTDRLRDALDERRLAAALASGDFAAAREIADRRCHADPLDESAHVALMRALSGEGRTADALSVFARLRRALSEQLGVDPGAQAVALNAQLVADDRDPAAAETASPDTARVGRPARARTVGLMVDASDLVGREDDIAAVVTLFEGHRLVTIQGPGGVGKTRVAHRIGDVMAESGRPVFYVSLAPIRDGDDVVPAIAAALGVGETDIGGGGRPRLAVGDLGDRLVDAVRGQRAVLILDNCEQVIERCARVVADLLAAEPQLSILTTSRSPLMLPAERIHLLPVLDVGERGAAVELFERRARAIRPAARLPRDEVAELCRHLDGLPLAIELAAARIRTMTVAEISSRLAERFSLLRGADRTAPDRHRTLYAVIEWSWDLLDTDARSAMRRLCRFPAGFTADAAAVVVGQRGYRLVDTLEALVNQSLLTVSENDDRIRYRMLEMVREFGEDKLRGSAEPAGSDESDESDDVDRAMSRWARGFAAEAEAAYETAVDDRLFTWIAADADNLVWVLRRCVGRAEEEHSADAVETIVSVFPTLSGFWMARGLHGEVMSWGARLLYALSKPPVDLDDAMRRRWQFTVLASMAHLLLRRELRGVAIGRYYIRLLHRPDHIFDRPTELLSACVLSRGPLGAMRLVSRATRADDEEVRTAALSIRMNARENFGDLAQALSDGLALRDIAFRHRNAWMSAMTHVTIGSLYGQQAQWETAVGFYRTGIGNLVELGARDDELQARCYLVATLVALGRLDEAGDELALVADGWGPDDPDPQGNPEVIGGMMLGYAELEYARGRIARSADIYWRAARLVKADHPLGAQDPGMVMLISAAVVGLVRAGRPDRTGDFLALLADGVNATFGAIGWHDQPQAGTMAMAAGYTLCQQDHGDPDGPRLLALSRRLGARRDHPGLDFVYTEMPMISGLPAAQWESIVEAVAQLSRRQATDEVRKLLAPRRG